MLLFNPSYTFMFLSDEEPPMLSMAWALYAEG
jgi:hypothetical protein